jgi:hypothetical protein
MVSSLPHTRPARAGTRRRRRAVLTGELRFQEGVARTALSPGRTGRFLLTRSTQGCALRSERRANSARSSTGLGLARRYARTAQENHAPLRRFHSICSLHRHRSGLRQRAPKTRPVTFVPYPHWVLQALNSSFPAAQALSAAIGRQVQPSCCRTRLRAQSVSARSPRHARPGTLALTFAAARARRVPIRERQFCGRFQPVRPAHPLPMTPLLRTRRCCYSPALTSFHVVGKRRPSTPAARRAGTENTEHRGVKAVFPLKTSARTPQQTRKCAIASGPRCPVAAETPERQANSSCAGIGDFPGDPLV